MPVSPDGGSVATDPPAGCPELRAEVRSKNIARREADEGGKRRITFGHKDGIGANKDQVVCQPTPPPAHTQKKPESSESLPPPCHKQVTLTAVRG